MGLRDLISVSSEMKKIHDITVELQEKAKSLNALSTQRDMLIRGGFNYVEIKFSNAVTVPASSVSDTEELIPIGIRMLEERMLKHRQGIERLTLELNKLTGTGQTDR